MNANDVNARIDKIRATAGLVPSKPAPKPKTVGQQLKEEHERELRQAELYDKLFKLAKHANGYTGMDSIAFDEYGNAEHIDYYGTLNIFERAEITESPDKQEEIDRKYHRLFCIFHDYYSTMPMKLLLVEHNISRPQLHRLLKKYGLPPVKHRINLKPHNTNTAAQRF